MNAHIDNVISELRRAGAKGLPSTAAIETATDGASWSGKLQSGIEWSLTKNNDDSYTCTY